MKTRPHGEGFIQVLQASKFHPKRLGWVIKQAERKS
jgi:hypothetical protein